MIWNNVGISLNIKTAKIDAETGSKRPIISICCGFTLPEATIIEVCPINVGKKIKPRRDKIEISLTFPNPWIRNIGKVKIEDER